ncbi:uncharacterized protein BT62DRAFT_927884 [Guyanagaster necrorhizus]|uniref:Tethering factor for nuclear proteasome STS1 n=1 Tax=Guyanagaster necrorhizus TaxID=856835 RepID=A0A9P7W102_9AGAR|nr:uncharacterized protein BT62DRAFT_927884 [Guyanagaster necrorhizus MCA 3950]KAG7450602.1 hypothetical protein BT62DRAFT_927884 [Guyanagaster necrorhizus MCA 3950]
MTNVLQSPIGFQPRPVNHAPSPFGFGFGLSSPSSAMFSPGWQQAAPTANQFSPSQNHNSNHPQPMPLRSAKRRHEPEEASDESMDQSPGPERRIKRASPKRARVVSAEGPKDEKKENKAPGQEDNDVDLGVLLASLPPQSLLPLLNSLIKAQPTLKSIILPLIPRPTVEVALHALSDSAKKLKDAYPYSNSSSLLGFGVSNKVSVFGGSGATFGKSVFGHSQHGQGPTSFSPSSGGGMRDDYIVSRLRPHITEFAAACMSYLPYFSYLPASAEPSNALQQSHSTTLRVLHKDKSQPAETFLFLSALTTHFLSQPPLALASLVPLLLDRLIKEWNAWVDRVDIVVNREGGMFGSETVTTWARNLDDFAGSKDERCAAAMRLVRDTWVAKVGWLVGRTMQHAMEET